MLNVEYYMYKIDKRLSILKTNTESILPMARFTEDPPSVQIRDILVHKTFLCDDKFKKTRS